MRYFKTEQLRKDNLELESSLSPRIFNDQGEAGKRLSIFAPVNAIIEYLPDRECKRTTQQIALTLDLANWSIIAVRANPDERDYFLMKSWYKLTMLAWLVMMLGGQVRRQTHSFLN